MAKKLTANQQQYKQQIKRIRSALSKLKSQGYDVSDLYDKYSNDLPKRVTSKLISELKSIKPKDLKTYIEQQDNKIQYTPQEMPETVIIDTPDTYISESQFETEQKDTIEEVPITHYEIDSNAGVVNEVTETGQVISQSELLIEETDESILYVNAETGEVLSIEPKTFFNTPDLSDMAIEYLRDMGNNFSPQVSQVFQKVIDYLIETKGGANVADAFGQVISNNPNISERISNAKEKYGAMRELFGELAEQLDLPKDMREEMRDILTRESMTDLEDMD